MGQPGCRDFFPYHVSTNAWTPSRFLLWESPHFGTPSHSLSEVAAQRNTNETGLPPLWRPRVPAAWFIFWPQEVGRSSLFVQPPGVEGPSSRV